MKLTITIDEIPYDLGACVVCMATYNNDFTVPALGWFEQLSRRSARKLVREWYSKGEDVNSAFVWLRQVTVKAALDDDENQEEQVRVISAAGAALCKEF